MLRLHGKTGTVLTTTVQSAGHSSAVTTIARSFSSEYQPNVPYPVKRHRQWKPVAPPKETVFQEIEEMEKLAKEREENFVGVRRSTADDFNLDFDLDLEVAKRSSNLQQKMFNLVETPEQVKLRQLEEDELFQRLVKAKIKEEALKERHLRLAAEAEEREKFMAVRKAAEKTEGVGEKISESKKQRSFSIVADPNEKHDGILSDEMKDLYMRAYSEAFPDRAATLDDMIAEGRQILLTKFKIARGELDPSHDIRVVVDAKEGVIEKVEDAGSLPSPTTATASAEAEAQPSPTDFEDFFAELSGSSAASRPAFPHMHVDVDPRVFQTTDDSIDPRSAVPKYRLEKPPKEYVNEPRRDRSKQVHLQPGDEGYVDPFEKFDDMYGNIGMGDIKLAKEQNRLFDRPTDYREQRRRDKERLRMREEAMAAVERGYSGDVRELLHPDDRGMVGKDGVYYSKPVDKSRPQYGLHMAEDDADDVFDMMMFDRLNRLNDGQKKEDKFDVWEEFKKWEEKRDESEEDAAARAKKARDEKVEEPRIDLDEDWGKNLGGQPEGAIPKSILFKSPLDYINRFVMRVHPDLFNGDSAMVIDDKSQFAFTYHNKGQSTNSFEGVLKDTAGVQVNNDRARLDEYESGHYRHPDNIRYYKLTMDFLRDHNTASLSKLNTVLDYHKAMTALSDVEQADPYANHTSDAPQRTIFTFFCRSRRGAPYARPDPAVIHPIEAPWTDRHETKPVVAEPAGAAEGEDATAAKSSAGKSGLAGKDSQHMGEVDEEDEDGKSKSKVKRPLKYVEIDEEELADMPHVRMVRVKFRPPKNPHAKTNHFDSKKSVSEMHAAIDRLLVELLMCVEDEVATQDMERWKRGIKQHRDRKAWLQNTKHLNEFNALFKKDKGYTVHGIDEKEAFLNSPMAFMHMYPQANRHHEKEYKEANHPKKHLFKAMMRGGCINFDKSLPPDMKLTAVQQLSAFITHGYEDFQCKKWWSRRMTEIELMEKRGNAKYLSQDDNPDNVVFNLGHDPEREELWPDPARGYGFKLHCAVHFLPAGTFFEPRIVSSNYKLKLAYRKSTFKDAMFMTLLESNGYELEDVTPGTVELGDEKQHVQNKSIVVPTAYSDVCLELYVPHNVRVDEFDTYVHDAYVRMAEWERLMRLHVQEKVLLKQLGLIEDGEDGEDGLGNDSGAWLRRLIQNPKARVDAEVMPHTHALVQFNREQLQRALAEDTGVGYSNVFGELSATEKYSHKHHRNMGAVKTHNPYGKVVTPTYDDDANAGAAEESDLEAVVFGDDSDREGFDYSTLMELYDPLARDNLEVMRTAYQVLSQTPQEELMFGDEVSDGDSEWSDALEGGERVVSAEAASAQDPVAILREKLSLSDDEGASDADVLSEHFEEDGLNDASESDAFAGYDVFVEEEVGEEDAEDLAERVSPAFATKPSAPEPTLDAVHAAVAGNEAQQRVLAAADAGTAPPAADKSASCTSVASTTGLENKLESLLSGLYAERANLQKAIVGLNKTKQLTQHVDIVRAYKRVLDLIKDKEIELEAVKRIRLKLEAETNTTSQHVMGGISANNVLASVTAPQSVVSNSVPTPKRVGVLAREIEKKRLLKHQDKLKTRELQRERKVSVQADNIPDEAMFGPADKFESFESPLHPAYISRIKASIKYSPYLTDMLVPQAPRVDDYGKNALDIIARHEKREYDRTHAMENHVARLLVKASNHDDTNIYKKLAQEKQAKGNAPAATPKSGSMNSLEDALGSLL